MQKEEIKKQNEEILRLRTLLDEAKESKLVDEAKEQKLVDEAKEPKLINGQEEYEDKLCCKCKNCCNPMFHGEDCKCQKKQALLKPVLECDCKNCCKRTYSKEGKELGCLCNVQLNYKFIIPFAISMFLSVMIYGHQSVDMSSVNEQVKVEFSIGKDDKTKLWFLKNSMSYGLFSGSASLKKLLQYPRHKIFLGINILGIIACTMSITPLFWVVV